MDKRYFFLTILALVIAVVILILPEKEISNEIGARELLLKIVQDTRFLSTDQVARMIIDKDPSLQLIDVRDTGEYAKFTLPGAINIPLAKILDEESREIIGQEEKTNVFFSNGTIHANQAWVLTTRLGYLKNFVMKGGLNAWIETIMQPPKPEISASQADIDLYEFRRGACQYFMGGTVSEPEIVEVAPVPVVRKKKKAVISGGC